MERIGKSKRISLILFAVLLVLLVFTLAIPQNAHASVESSAAGEIITHEDFPEEIAFGAADVNTVYELTATVLPAQAPQAVDWYAGWVNPDSEFASGKDVQQYVTVTPDSDGSTSAYVECKKPFGEQVAVTVVSRDNTACKQTCIADYVKRVSNVDVVFKGNGKTVDFGKTINELSLKTNLTTASYTYDSYSVAWGVGTVENAVQSFSYNIVLNEVFDNICRQNGMDTVNPSFDAINVDVGYFANSKLNWYSKTRSQLKSIIQEYGYYHSALDLSITVKTTDERVPEYTCTKGIAFVFGDEERVPKMIQANERMYLNTSASEEELKALNGLELRLSSANGYLSIKVLYTPDTDYLRIYFLESRLGEYTYFYRSRADITDGFDAEDNVTGWQGLNDINSTGILEGMREVYSRPAGITDNDILRVISCTPEFYKG